MTGAGQVGAGVPAGRGGASGQCDRAGDDPVVSVCVLVVDPGSPIERCLDALAAPGGCPEGTEVVVVANGSPPGVTDRLRDRRDVALVESRVNVGFAGGCNLAATLSAGELLVFLNDDSVVEPGCLAALVGAAREDPGLAAVGARILSPDGTVQEAGSVLWRDGSTSHVADGMPDRRDVAASARDVDVVSANGLLVTRQAFESVGGFDETYFPAYFEDVDLCLALAAAGHRVRYEPRARLVHAGSHSTDEAFRRFLLERNRRLLCARWGDALERFPPRPRPDRGRGFARAVARSAATTHGGRPVAGAGSSGDDRRDGAPVLDRDAQARRAVERRAGLELEYLAFLERRWVEDGDRLADLQAYVATRPVVRAKRALARLAGRR